MKVKDFVNLVNSKYCEEFSDVPEDDVELVKSRVSETWSFDESYSTSMNVYKCDDGFAGVIGVCHINENLFGRNPGLYANLPRCIAVEVTEVLMPTFVPNPNNAFLKFSECASKPVTACN
jgi:hypothetical protein